MRRLWRFGGGKEVSGQLRIFGGFERLIFTFSATIPAVASWYLFYFIYLFRAFQAGVLLDRDVMRVHTAGPLSPISRGQVFATEEQINIDDKQSCTIRGITLMSDARIQIGLG